MKRSFAFLFQVVFLSTGCFSQPSAQPVSSEGFQPDPAYKEVTKATFEVLNSNHYRPQELNDSFSSKVFDNYLKRLDYNRTYFVGSDVSEFEKYRYELDDRLQEGDVSIAFLMYNRLQQRLNERIQYTYTVLKDSFRFDQEDSFMVDRESAPWCSTTAELDQLWKQKLKFESLSLYSSGKSWSSYSETLQKRYENFEKQITKTKAEDVYDVFMNAITQVYDPHTDYFSPRQSEDFNISMSLSLEGIGATLSLENDYTKVREVTKGGPAERSKKIHPNDRIIAVAQGKDGEFVDVIGWRIDDVVRLIRGPKGSVVRLKVLKAKDGNSAQPVIIELVRDKIKLEEQSAKGEIKEYYEDKKKHKMGVITLPSFYMDFAAAQRGERDYKSTTRDVKNLITDLRKKGAEGIVIDLRNNGGGSLAEAINLTGLFISNGPVVQVKNADGTVQVHRDYDGKVFYDGPLTVLVNRFSASASEIFAAAIQDYNRGIIIGEKTYGKGTVQNFADLSENMSLPKNKAGQLKLTIAKFYRVNGSTTQFEGVIPDIQFPSAFEDKKFGEEGNPFSLPWDQINTTNYRQVANLDAFRQELRKDFETRMQGNAEYKYLLDDVAAYKADEARHYFSLNASKLKAEEDEEDKRNKEREKQREEARKQDKNLAVTNDIVLTEAMRINLVLQAKVTYNF